MDPPAPGFDLGDAFAQMSVSLRSGSWPRGPAVPGDPVAEGVKALSPEAPVAIEPEVGFLQGRWIDGVELLGSDGADRREVVVPQDAEMRRDSRLGNPELLLDDGSDLAGGTLKLGEQFPDPAPDRISRDLEDVHIDVSQFGIIN